MVEGGRKGRVCVTGGTGFVASWLIHRLLQHGYSVNTTIRPPPPSGEKKDNNYLTSLPGVSENLTIFHADLRNPDSFFPAINGCTGVFHVAHPIDTRGLESEEAITQRAIDGVIGILRACIQANTVKRVVCTSSVAAIVYNAHASPPNATAPLQVDESSWTDGEFVRAAGNMALQSYAISKTMAEKAGEEFAEKHGIEWVAVNPSFIMGPFLTPSIPTSVFISLALIFGNTKMYHYLMNLKMVHVDDLARAQIHLLEYPHAQGRYIVSATQIQLLDMSEYLAARYPDLYQEKDDSLKGVKGPIPPNLSTKKLLETGFEFKYGIDEIFDDAIRCCKQKGIL